MTLATNAPAERNPEVFRSGDIVLHPRYGLGTALEDSADKLLPLVGRTYQPVKVKFSDATRDVVAELAGLVLVAKDAPSENSEE